MGELLKPMSSLKTSNESVETEDVNTNDIIPYGEDVKKEIFIEEINFTHQIFGEITDLDLINSKDDKSDDQSDFLNGKINSKVFSIPKSNADALAITNTEEINEQERNYQLSCHLCEYSAFRKAYRQPIMDLTVCSTPNLKFTDKTKVKEHITNAHPNFKMRKCHFCEYETMYKSSLDRHIDGIHLNLRNHKCHLCDFSSTRKYDLKRHVDNVHLNLRIHKCPLCKFSSNRKHGLKKHMENIHLYSWNEAKVDHQSDIAGLRSQREKLLNEAMEDIELRASIRKIVNCDVTEAPPAEGSHSPMKNYKCHLCGYGSNRESNVERHIFFVHLKSKTAKISTKPLHECNFCDFTTKDRASLRKHVDGIHLNLRNHKCHLCDYTSNQSGTLKNHVNAIHLNLRKHKCHFCRYTSNHKNVLKTHLQRKHFFPNFKEIS